MKYCLARVIIPDKYLYPSSPRQKNIQYFWVRNEPPFMEPLVSTPVDPLWDILVYEVMDCATGARNVVPHEWTELSNEYAEEIKPLSWSEHLNLDEKDVLALRIK